MRPQLSCSRIAHVPGHANLFSTAKRRDFANVKQDEVGWRVSVACMSCSSKMDAENALAQHLVHTVLLTVNVENTTSTELMAACSQPHVTIQRLEFIFDAESLFTMRTCSCRCVYCLTLSRRYVSEAITAAAVPQLPPFLTAPLWSAASSSSSDPFSRADATCTICHNVGGGVKVPKGDQLNRCIRLKYYARRL